MMQLSSLTSCVLPNLLVSGAGTLLGIQSLENSFSLVQALGQGKAVRLVSNGTVMENAWKKAVLCTYHGR